MHHDTQARPDLDPVADPPPRSEPQAGETDGDLLDNLSEPQAGETDGDLLDNLWPPESARAFQDRWREVQLKFVDNPQAATDEAEALVSEVLDEFATAMATRKQELANWRSDEEPNTEQMRMVVRQYRKLLDRLVEV